MKTYRVNKEILANDLFFNYEANDNLGIGPAYSNLQIGNEQTSEFSIFNKIGSGQKITINTLQIEPTSRHTNSTENINAGNYSINRISAQTGGIAIKPIKMNSSVSTPSGISIKYKTNDTISNEIRRMSVTMRAITTSTNFLCLNNTYGNAHMNNISTLNFTGTGSMLLREGEGINLIGTQCYHNPAVRIDILIRDNAVGGFGTVSYSIDTTLDKTTSMISIFNPSGSGKVFFVDKIDVFPQVKVSVTSAVNVMMIPSFHMYPIINHLKGNNLTPISMDSLNSALSSLIEIREKASVKYSYDQGKVAKPMLTFLGTGVLNTNSTNFGYSTLSRLNMRDYELGNELYEGEGIAIMCGTPNDEGKYELIVDFTVEDYTEPSGGLTSYGYASS